jgi:hypothetical protein
MSNAQTYLAHIAAYEREFSKWERRGEKILKQYRDDAADSRKSSKFNVLWSNVQTLKAATFSRMPKPDVSRRFKDDDPIGRVASLMLERALEFEVEHYKDFGATLRQCVYDRFLPGRGVAWVRYEPTFKQEQAGEAQPGETLTEDQESESEASESLDYECAPVDYVHWRDFGHAVARTWEEVPIVWRKVYLGRQARDKHIALWKKLGALKSSKVPPLDEMPEEMSKARQSADTDAVNKRALLYEIWDKETGKCVFLSKSLSAIIAELDDPLGLEEFFPCPPPLYATLTTDSLVPLPDFTLYQDQAAELNVLADRIDGLVKQLQVKGCYDGATPELARLFTEGANGDLIAVKNWAAFAEKKGLDGAISLVDLAPIAAALKEAYLAFEQIKGQIYELTGISDIIRGETAPSETATAQQIKNNYASMRLKTYQDEVERFATRLLQIKAQILCNHFDESTLIQISGAEQLSQEDQALVPQALALLKSNVTRMFRIEVATDSMVFQDEQQDKADSMEFLNAVSGFLEKAVQAPPALAPLLAELLKFGVRQFRAGKNVEGAIDNAADRMKELANQPQQDPNAAKAQAQVQTTQIQEQSAQQQTAMQEQAETQRQQMQQQHEQQMAAIDAQRDAQLQAMQQQHEAQMQMVQQQHAEAMEKVQNMLALILQRMKDGTTLQVAEMANDTTLQAAQISASKGADE